MKISRIISGTMNWGIWGVNHSETDMSKLILESFNSGVNSFDHADIYGGYTTEKTFGNAFKKTGIPRENVIFISKFGIMYPSKKLPINIKHYDYSAEHINLSVNNSLKNLKTQYIDCLLLHRPSPLMDSYEISESIQNLINQGKVKSFGVSNFTSSQMDLFKGKIKISFNQINLSLTHLNPMFDGTLDYMITNNITPMAYSPLGSYFKIKNLKMRKIIKNFCNKYKCSEDQLLLSWLMKHPSKIHPVIGTTKFERIKNSVKAIDISIDTIDWFEILEGAVGKRVP